MLIAKISQNTRPLYFSREVFGIATSSAVWAQELTLQRYSLLKRVNQQLNFNVKDIRFTPARWTDKIILPNQVNTADNQDNIAFYEVNKAILQTKFLFPKQLMRVCKTG